MTHPLHSDPRCHKEDLGRPIPDSLHAVSVCLPTWDDVIGYEEKEPRVMQSMSSGYPRFFIHSLIHKLCGLLAETYDSKDHDIFPFPDGISAKECARFIGDDARTVECGGGLHAVVFPREKHSRAQAYWQHSGRILSSRAAEDWIRNRQLRPTDASLESLVISRLAAWSGAPESFVSLHPCGMSAVLTALQIALSRRPRQRTVMFGFPYTDTLKILEKFGSGVEFLPTGDENDLKALARILEKEPIAAIFCEFPSNPLLTVSNLPKIQKIAASTGTPVIVDETIASFFNTQLLPHADILVTSLTKAISGEGDVMAGALTINPDGLLANVPLPSTSNIYIADLEVLEKNSRDFPQRMQLSNDNALDLARFLQSHPAVEKVYYPGLNPSPIYEALRKPQGGYSSLLSFLPKNAQETSPRIYEKIALNRGISFGTTYSLICPYVQLAHYTELDWVRQCGINPYLLRVAVGSEKDLVARFAAALE